jgi:DNA adenine methylase
LKPFLKWAGNKYRLLDKIQKLLPHGECLIEPFVGAGAVFLNTTFERYLLTDINPDLIHLYQLLQADGEQFIAECKPFFTEQSNEKTCYLALREQFNQSVSHRERAILFVYLNRHGYNGLCRYNSRGHFNVPFGRYSKPYFPEAEMRYFHQKAQAAKFTVQDFRRTITNALPGDVIYCDPPYVPISATANFTGYAASGFSQQDQLDLATLAQKVAQKGIPVLISNHDNTFTQEAYRNAQQSPFPVQRYISCQGENRQPAMEVLALFR